MLRSSRGPAAVVMAGLLVAGTAFAAGGPKPGANNGGVAQDGSAMDGAPVKERHGFGDTLDNVKSLDSQKRPLFGIRVNSMNFVGDAKRVACFDYSVEGLRPNEDRETYQLVRTLWRGRILRNDPCDEVLGLPLPPDADVRYVARMITTRWMRDVGPNGTTPVGGFIGDLRIGIVPTATTDEAVDQTVQPLPILAFRTIGTTGLRLMRGDPLDALWNPEERCSAPLHEEGFYQGGFDKRGLKALIERFGDDANVPKLFRTLHDAQIIGTFEGRLEMGPSDTESEIAREFDYCALSKGGWWFDGLLGWRARHPKVEGEPSPAQAVVK